MKPAQDGFYWLHRENREPTIGRWENDYGWSFFCDMLKYDPDDPNDAAVLGEYTLGERVRP